MNNKDKSVSLKELREKFYELRDLEIQNLWQRASIFAGLIGLFFAGYGYILIGFLGKGEDQFEQVGLAHVLCCGIAILAIIFSVIWIAMAKGAKAWFEVQERKICEIEEEEELAIPARFRMGTLSYPGIDSEPDFCLLSRKGGRYSVSKLNILLGQVLLVCWCGIFILHFVLLICGYGPKEISVGLAIFLGLLMLFFCLVFKRAKSSVLLTTQQYLQKRLRLLKADIERIVEDPDIAKILSQWIDKKYAGYIFIGNNLVLNKEHEIEKVRAEIKVRIAAISLPHVSSKERLEKKAQVDIEIFAFFRSVIDTSIER